jgi:hypothetical protein
MAHLLDFLKGKKINYMTEVNVMVQLEIEEVKEQHHSRELEPATRENDWWPRSDDFITYKIRFTNGFEKSFKSLSEINLVE